MVAAFPLDISWPPFVLFPLDTYPSSAESSGMLLLMSDYIFCPQLCLAKKAFILGLLPYNITPKSLPLFISADLYLMSIHPQTYEVSSDWAPDPIHFTRPNTPTIYLGFVWKEGM